MKKFLFMLLMSISVAIFAVPPPAVTDVVANEIQFVIQDEVQINSDFEAQEVAYVYTGDTYIFSCLLLIADMELKLEFPELVMDDELLTYDDQLNRPPANSDFAELLTDKQHSNYGYLFSMN